MKNKYEDIINLPHHISNKHSQMKTEDRAAQFAPFSALTGYEENVKETARITDNKIELDEEIKKILNKKINKIKNKINTKPKIIITYFIPDERKKGGKYVKINGVLKKIDEYYKKIILENGEEILIEDIIEIENVN